MMCKMYFLLFKILPLNSLRARLIDHFEKCPKCRVLEETESLIEAEFRDVIQWASQEKSLWPAVTKSLSPRGPAPGRERHPFPVPLKPQWIMAGLAFLAFIGVNLLLLLNPGQNRLQEKSMDSLTSPRIIITYAKIKGKDAKPQVFQTSKTSFIMLQESHKSGGST